KQGSSKPPSVSVETLPSSASASNVFASPPSRMGSYDWALASKPFVDGADAPLVSVAIVPSPVSSLDKQTPARHASPDSHSTPQRPQFFSFEPKFTQLWPHALKPCEQPPPTKPEVLQPTVEKSTPTHNIEQASNERTREFTCHPPSRHSARPPHLARARAQRQSRAPLVKRTAPC